MSVHVSSPLANGAFTLNYNASSPSTTFPQVSIHQEEKNLPGGRRWVVQKFGGTSVGKFARSIALDIVKPSAEEERVAVVCSARSTNTKSEGTTNRLLRAAREAEKPMSRAYIGIIEAIRVDHIQAAKGTIKSVQLVEKLSDEINVECDSLIKILESAQHLEEVSARAEDKIMSKGEKLSCRFMATLLQDVGVNAVYIDLADVLRPLSASSNGHAEPKPLDEDFYKNVGRVLAEQVFTADKLSGSPIVPVLTGYFGPIPGGLLSSIGRGYTDLAAALLAVGLSAHELQIWKEVDGIFTADPRKVPTARLLPSVTPSEAAELTFYGSEVIHPFTMEQAISARIRIRIKNVKNPRNAGTVIIPDPTAPDEGGITAAHERKLFRTRSSTPIVHHQSFPPPPSHRRTTPKRPTAVTMKHNIVILNVHSNKRTRAHGFLMTIFNILDRHHLSVDLLSSSEVHVSMALHSSDPLLSEAPADRPPATPPAVPSPSHPPQFIIDEEEETLSIANASLQAAVAQLAAHGTIDIVPRCAIISLIGSQLRNMVGISGRFLSTLGREGINIEMISQGASEINISCVVREREADRALNVVHTNLFTFLDD